MFEHSAKKPSGHVIATDFDGNVTVADTMHCHHCGMHWIVRPGSKRKRGFCMKCMGVTCGKPACDTCTPYKALMDQ